MKLPKIDVPTTTYEMPVSGTKVELRPYTVKEEKILLFAQQAATPEDIGKGIRNVIENCIINDVDIDALPGFEVDLIFLKLRAMSVNNIVSVKLRSEEIAEDPADQKYYDVEVNLDEVNIKIPEDYEDTLQLNDEYSIKLKYPNFGDFGKLEVNEESPLEVLFDMASVCIDSIFNEDEVFIFADYDKKEQKEFVESLSSQNFQDIQAFLGKQPALEHDIIYDADGEMKTRTLRGLFDFFTSA
tara:strand:+ start:2240 stop:2965 length:726 start_codon:yes stop_codon:yes gene_type:complete